MLDFQQKIEKFRIIVKENFRRKDFTYHEWMVEYHLDIVERIAFELCEFYPEANKEIVQTLVWFHDFGKPIDEENEREITLVKGPMVLSELGFPEQFVNTVVDYWKLFEQKNEIDLRTAPIEVQIVSSADGASHLTGVFYPSYFGDEPKESFQSTQEHLREKIEKDWNRKIVLPEARKAFEQRYLKAKELLGIFPDKFIG